MVFAILIKVCSRRCNSFFLFLFVFSFQQMISNDNLSLGKFFESLSAIGHKGEKVTLDSNVISLKNLIPGKHAYSLTLNLFLLIITDNTKDYYTYDGSLTTPMCYESVRWIVFRERIGLSRNQVINDNDFCQCTFFSLAFRLAESITTIEIYM